MGRDFLRGVLLWRLAGVRKNLGAVEFLLHAAGGSFFERGLHIERPTPVSAAASVGSRQSATGARSPPSHAYTFLKEGTALAREGDFYFQNII